MNLFTVGYEAATLPEVVGRLQSAGVRLLIDVRAIAASRRPGFSKTALSASLAEAGIDYLHLRALGTPSEGRAAARAGRTAEMRAIFAAHLEEPAAQLALLHAAEAAAARPSALLCYEKDAAVCHRAMIADLLSERLGCAIHDL
ncbi:MAG: DUF488 domain-containing protein [Proteobacteria bacterium]|nr:DUF488 domain-containing protein [Pseudomonadota bacterium]